MTAEIDIVIVGAGFAGLYQLIKLRELGYSIQVYEQASDIGGTWYWNCYPGARVDSPAPIYAYSLEELWREWKWTEKYASRDDILAYLNYVDIKFNVKRDIKFNTRVVAAEFNTTIDRWAVTTSDGIVVHPRFLILCTGVAAKPYIPDFKGLDTFKGIHHHTAQWPQEGVDLAGKRVGVVGTGGSGVQVIEEIAGTVNHLTVFQRTPSVAFPMTQELIDQASESEARDNGDYQQIYSKCKTTFFGYPVSQIPKNAVDVSDEERSETFEKLWSTGGMWFLVGTYQDIYTSKKGNELAYAFWKDKTRARIHDTIKQELLVPTVARHPLGAKRISLEQGYYEVYNRDNVSLVDIAQNPIVEITPKGILTQDGVEHELDIIVFATGFDAVTGSMSLIDIKGTDGIPVGEKWTKGLTTYVGLMIAKYPNMFFKYGPHGPTAFCNGPTCIEVQGDWIVNCINYARANDIVRIEANDDAQSEWVKFVNDTYEKQLLSKTKSWYNGANIPGKKVETLNFTGGLPVYDKWMRKVAEKGYEGCSLKFGDKAVVAT